MLGRLFKHATPSPAQDAPPAFPPPRPEGTVYAIGDVHGRSDLLDALLARIDADAADHGATAPAIFLLGDYVDRGPDSRGVIDRAVALEADRTRRVTCLMGNHEAMMFEFIDQTGTLGHVWLDNGGLATLESYGVAGLLAERDATTMARAAAEFAEAMGAAHLAWLRGLPRQAWSGNVHFVHAAADPFRPMDDQDPEMLIWGRPSRRAPPRPDGQWVVHGHTIVETPVHVPGRINVDTGAVHSGRLTAARIAGGEVEFLST